MNYSEMSTTALGKLVSDRTGVACKSRNREALVRKLEKMDGARMQAVKDAGYVMADASGMSRILEQYATAGADVVAGGAKSLADAMVGDGSKIKVRLSKRKPRAKTAAIHSDPALHAPALAYVRRAMARKSKPSLRALCAELNAKGIKTPWGRKMWWPASVQNLIRQIAKEVA